MSTAFQTTIDDLPDQVLGAIIALAGKRNGPSMRRVCKRWDAAVFAEPSFWKEFILAPPRRIKTPAGQQSWLLLKLAQLRRIGAWVRAFKVLDWSILEAEVTSSRSKRPTFTSFLELLDPGLTSLLLGSAEQLTPGAVASLDTFTQLASLSLHTPICVLPPGAAHTLTRLTALQTCSLQALHLTADLVAGLATMRQLSRLDLHFAIAVQPVSLLQLTALDSLSQLNVRLTASRGDLSVPLAVPPPTALPRLTSYSYCAQDGLQMVLSRAVEPGQSGSAALKKCAFVLGAHPSIAGAQAGCLDISHSTCLPSLQALLLELLPAGQPFSYLSLEHCHFTEAAALENCSLLAQLPALLFNSCTLLGGIEDALEALLRQATRLEALSCIGSLTADFGLPQCLTSQSRLKKLLLRQNFLDELPEGEYLKHLEMLDIGGRNFEETELPIQLKLATKLTRLVLNKSSTIKIRRDDITDILMEMSSLQQLDLGSHTVSEFVLDQLEETLPNLKISQV